MPGMGINFETTITEADFKKPLLDPKEDQLARDLAREKDFTVDGLANSLFGRLLNLFSGRD